MKTVVVIEDSKVTVQVDDQKPIEVPANSTRSVEQQNKPAANSNVADPECGYCRKRGSACKRHGGTDSQVYQSKRGPGRSYRAADEKQKAWNNGKSSDDESRLAESAPPAKYETRSECHNAKVKVVGGDEGTNHYECLACGQACIVKQQLPPFHDRWNCGACREAGRPCRLHADLEADGKEPPRFGP